MQHPLLKQIKIALLFLFVAFVIASLFIIAIRRPHYSIHTTGKLYVVNKASRDITVIDLSNGKTISSLAIGIESHGLAFLPRVNKLVVSNYNTNDVKDKSIQVINTVNDSAEHTMYFREGLGLNGITALPSSNNFGVLSKISNALLIVNFEKGTVEKKIPTQQKSSHSIATHPKKNIAFVTNSASGSVSVIDLEINKVIKTITCGLGTQGIAVTPDGSQVWVTNKAENSITVIDASSYDVIERLRAGKEPLRLQFSIDGNYCLVTNCVDGTVSVFNQKTRKEIKVISIPGKTEILERLLYHTPRPVNILMHPNGQYAFVSNSNANKIEVIDMKTFEIVSTIGTGKVPDAMAFVE